jgi:hypothetical protein
VRGEVLKRWYRKKSLHLILSERLVSVCRKYMSFANRNGRSGCQGQGVGFRRGSDPQASWEAELAYVERFFGPIHQRRLFSYARETQMASQTGRILHLWSKLSVEAHD